MASGYPGCCFGGWRAGGENRPFQQQTFLRDTAKPSAHTHATLQVHSPRGTRIEEHWLQRSPWPPVLGSARDGAAWSRDLEPALPVTGYGTLGRSPQRGRPGRGLVKPSLCSNRSALGHRQCLPEEAAPAVTAPAAPSATLAPAQPWTGIALQGRVPEPRKCPGRAGTGAVGLLLPPLQTWVFWLLLPNLLLVRSPHKGGTWLHQPTGQPCARRPPWKPDSHLHAQSRRRTWPSL